jgi:hypothetical protein
MEKKTIFLLSLLCLGGFLASCSSGGDGAASSTTSSTIGSASLYLTDDLGAYQQVQVTVTGVQLQHTGQGTTCDLLPQEEVVDLANLSDQLHWVAQTNCEAIEYNRLRLDFAQSVQMMDGKNQAGSCSFQSWKESGTGNPNRLNCVNGNCSVEMTGAVNVAAGQTTRMAIDFDLKQFEVQGLGTPNCSATMKVEPLNHNGMESKKSSGYREGLTGTVSALVVGQDAFTISTKRQATFAVDYSHALFEGQPQPDLDGLLAFAAQNNLRVRVMTASLPTAPGEPIGATTIFVKLAGPISALDEAARNFTLTAGSLVIPVDYSEAAKNSGNGEDNVEGILANGEWVEVTLYGISSSRYLAHKVEVTYDGATVTDD